MSDKLLSAHERALAEYAGGWLLLPMRTLSNYGVNRSQELPPVIADTEIEALRLYYALTRDGLVVRIHPEPVKRDACRPTVYRLVRKEDG